MGRLVTSFYRIAEVKHKRYSYAPVVYVPADADRSNMSKDMRNVSRDVYNAVVEAEAKVYGKETTK